MGVQEKFGWIRGGPELASTAIEVAQAEGAGGDGRE